MRLVVLATGAAAALLACGTPALADTQPPSIESVAPATGPATGGTKVTISGIHFGGATEVDFGETPATSFSVGNDQTTITAVAPAGSGVVDVRVTTAAGTSAKGSGAKFRYQPAIASLDPDNGSISGDTAVTIDGGGFTGATAVDFGDTPATDFVVVSDTQILATAPEGGGTVAVTVTTPTGATPSGARYRYVFGITSTDPGPGGNQVTLHGLGFAVARHVRLGGSYPGFVVVSDTKMIVLIPTGATPSGIVVETPYGTTKGVSSSLLPSSAASPGAGGGSTVGSTFPVGSGTTSPPDAAPQSPLAQAAPLVVLAGPTVTVTPRVVRVSASVTTGHAGALRVGVVDARGRLAGGEAVLRVQAGTRTVRVTVPRARVRRGVAYRLRVRDGATAAFSRGFALR